jgi:2-C-methyl-D-erythritol 4-phosphate cytidylyltransferase
MTTWGVLRLPDGDVSGGLATGEGAVGAAVAAHLDGVVAIAHDAPLATALASLPAHVTTVVELDAADAATGEPGPQLENLMRALDEEHAAVVAARPMADALKRVEGDVVVEGLERDGLLAPCLPHVYRRAVLTTVLAGSDAGSSAGTDAIGLMLDAGHAVRVVPTAGAPVTVRSR